MTLKTKISKINEKLIENNDKNELVLGMGK